MSQVLRKSFLDGPLHHQFHWGNIYRDGEVAQPQILNILLISSVILKGEGGQRTSPSLFKILSLLLGQPSPHYHTEIQILLLREGGHFL